MMDVILCRAPETLTRPSDTGDPHARASTADELAHCNDTLCLEDRRK